MAEEKEEGAPEKREEEEDDAAGHAEDEEDDEDRLVIDLDVGAKKKASKQKKLNVRKIRKTCNFFIRNCD